MSIRLQKYVALECGISSWLLQEASSVSFTINKANLEVYFLLLSSTNMVRHAIYLMKSIIVISCNTEIHDGKSLP